MASSPFPHQVTDAVTELWSPTYQDSDSHCWFNFFLYLSGVNPVVRPLLHHIDLDYLSILDTITTNVSTDGVWTKVEIGLGRHRDTFRVGFSLIHTGDPYSDGVAVDEVDFFNCRTPLPVEGDCPAGEEPYFHCTISKACVQSTFLCDYQDDCGDNSDEMPDGGAGCRNYSRSNFEDPDHPLGMFTQGEEGYPPKDFQWVRANGSTLNDGTGPPFDHTIFSRYGHYLYIGSEKGAPGDFAWLWSPILEANQPE